MLALSLRMVIILSLFEIQPFEPQNKNDAFVTKA
jgi:hypothetical protein